MNDYIPLAQLYREAVQNFPFPDLKRSGGAEGTLDDDLRGDGAYSEDFCFMAGQLLKSTIKARGCIECTREGQRVKIVACFWLSVKTGLFGKYSFPKMFVRGEYKRASRQWRLRLETIE